MEYLLNPFIDVIWDVKIKGRRDEKTRNWKTLSKELALNELGETRTEIDRRDTLLAIF